MYDHAYLSGITFTEFLMRAAANREKWLAMAIRARVAPETIAAA